MNLFFVPGPFDESLQMERAITKSADFAGTAFDFGEGYAPGGCGRPVGVCIVPSALAFAEENPDESYAFTVQESDDGNNWTDISPAVPMQTLAPLTIAMFSSSRYLRVGLNVGGEAPSVTYSAWAVPL